VSLQSGTTTSIQKTDIIEGIKSIIDKRISTLGLTEPTIQTANYGQESHIIVQIPTQDYGDVSDEEKKRLGEEDITSAKETIGKVVKLEFREAKTEITDADRVEREEIANAAQKEITDGMPFETVGAKYRDQYENVAYITGSGTLPKEATFSGVDAVTTFPYISPVVMTETEAQETMNASGEILTSSGMR